MAKIERFFTTVYLDLQDVSGKFGSMLPLNSVSNIEANLKAQSSLMFPITPTNRCSMMASWAADYGLKLLTLGEPYGNQILAF